MIRKLTLTYRITFASTLLLAALFGLSVANAGPIYLYLNVDPPTTAGAGIPNVNGLGVTSSRSGVGTWHLFAVDDVNGSFGIRNYQVTLAPGAGGGTIPAINHRSPNDSAWDTATFDGPFASGFNDLRSGTNSNPIQAGQGFVNSPQIGGFGQTFGDFATSETTTGNVPASHPGVISGQWGIYNDGTANSGLLSNGPRYALFLAEGTYTGPRPTVSQASFVIWTNSALTNSSFAPSYGLNVYPFFPEPTAICLVAPVLVAFSVRRSARSVKGSQNRRR